MVGRDYDAKDCFLFQFSLAWLTDHSAVPGSLGRTQYEARKANPDRSGGVRVPQSRPLSPFGASRPDPDGGAVLCCPRVALLHKLETPSHG